MRIRHLTILLLPVLLAGCGLPPAIAVASYAADGLLLVTTGKSSTDHALSFAVGEDCAMWRVVQGEAVCTELSPEGGSQIALEKTDDLSDVDGDHTAIAAAPPGTITSQKLAPPAELGTAPAPAAPADRVAVAGTLTESDRAATAAPVSLLPVTATPEQTAPDTSTAPLRVARIEPIAPMAAPRLIAVAELPRGTVIAAASPAGEAALPAGHYFVLASYRDRSNAERHAASLRVATARIMAAEIDGVAHYRVLAGPYASAERATAQAALAAAGIGESWPLDLCGGDCKRASQIASAE